MVHVKFYGLIRSNHKIQSIVVNPGSLQSIINEIQKSYPKITKEEFDFAVIFVNSKKIMHFKKYDEIIKDGDEVIFTNFVGGG